MKAYFTEKLKEVNERIKSTEKNIIGGITGTGNNSRTMEGIVELSKRLIALKDNKKELTTDAVKYCTVDEIIEIGSLTNYIGDETLNLLDKYSLESGYKYNSKAITIQERDKLIAKFGYSLKEAKV